MDLSRKMFLLAAEELNFTHAARQAHVTQQCLSSHIKKLEEKYQTELFVRRPVLKLSPAGQSLYQSLQKLEIIENSIDEQIADIREEQAGNIIFGINATRARILIPDILFAFYKEYPKVKVSLVLDDMCNLVPMLKNGELDIFLGVDCPSDKDFHRIPVVTEEVYVIGKPSTFIKYALPGANIGMELEAGSIDLKHFQNIPMVANKAGSSFSNLVLKYLDSLHIDLNAVLSVSDYEVQIDVCSRSELISFCPKSALELVLHNNRHFKEKGIEPLGIFHLKNLDSQLQIDLVTHKDLYLSKYKKSFIQLVHGKLVDLLETIDSEI